MYDPKLDEIWNTTTQTTTQEIGVVSEIRESTVVFLSLTGFRASVMWRPALGWTRTKDPIPVGGSACPRRGCERRAFLAYEREGVTELVCAYHAPSGAQLRITELTREVTMRSWSQCKSCSMQKLQPH